MKHEIKAWIDDFTLHTKTEWQLLEHLQQLFNIFAKQDLFLSAKESVFYTKEVKWCGRIIDSSGYKLDPRNIEAIRTTDNPINASEFCHFIHCCRWMSTSIPDFHKRMQPMDNIPERTYSQGGKRKKTALKSIPPRNLSWGTEHQNAIASIQASLRSGVKMAFPKPEHVVCIYTDASEELWALVVTQTKAEELQQPVMQKQHEPLGFFAGKLKGAQRYWMTYEKEAYAVVQTFDRLDYLFWGSKQTHVFTDHRNLLYVFAPLGLRPNCPRHVLSKVHRRAIHLSRLEVFINHIEGKSNVFADILTRWSKGYKASKSQPNMIAALYKDTIPSSTCLSTVSTGSIKTEQEKHEPPEEASEDEKGLYKIRDKICIPTEATNLKLMIAVNSHCGEKGHRAYAATMNTVSSEYWWAEMKLDIKEFIQSCIHCIVSRHGESIPRPLSTALHGEKPNEVLHVDFIYMWDQPKEAI